MRSRSCPIVQISSPSSAKVNINQQIWRYHHQQDYPPTSPASEYTGVSYSTFSEGSLNSTSLGVCWSRKKILALIRRWRWAVKQSSLYVSTLDDSHKLRVVTWIKAVERRQVKWLKYVVSVPPGCHPLEVFRYNCLREQHGRTQVTVKPSHLTSDLQVWHPQATPGDKLLWKDVWDAGCPDTTAAHIQING